ncbi:MAG: DNRLRE domain-containing protein [Acidimicrobiales bacterium]
MMSVRRWSTRRSLFVVLVAATTVALSVSAAPAQPSPTATAQSSTPPAPGTGATVQPPTVAMPALPTPAAVSPTAAQLAVSAKTVPGVAPDPAAPSPVAAQGAPRPEGAAAPTGELTGSRTTTSRTFATAKAGQFVTQDYDGPVTYHAADGELHDIDPTLIPAGIGRYQTTATAAGLNLAANPTDPSLAVVSFDADHSVAFGLAGAAAGPAAAPQTVAATAIAASGQAIVHAGIEPGVNMVLAAGDGGLKETLVLASAAAPESFVFPLHLTGLTATVDPASGDVVYRDSTAKIWGDTPAGSMSDSKIDPRSGDPATSQGVTYTIVAYGTGQALQVTLNHAWLTDPARLYPVSVDPSVAPDASDDTYAYSLSPPGPTYDNSSDYQLKVGTFDTGTNVARSFMHFNNLGYLNGNQVTAAVLYLYEFHSYTCTAETTNIYSVSQAWTGSAVTMFPGPSLGGLAASASSAAGDTCGGGAWVAFDVTSTVANWAATNGASNLGLAAVAPSETNSNLWKLFYSWNQTSGGASTTPYLNITWNTPATAPSSPTNASATPANNSAVVTWNLSASNGGAAIDSYWVNAFDGNTGAFVTGSTVEVCATCTTATVSGLTNLYPYYFGVYAHNAVNFSAPDYTATIKPTPPPGVPQGAVATPGNASAAMVWAPPVANGGSAVTQYAVLAYYTNDTYSGHDIVVCATCYTATVTGLTNGTAYNLFVFAGNPANYGPGAESGPVTANANVPSAPTTPTAFAPGVGSIGLYWYPAASAGAAAISQYAVNTYDLATGFITTSVIIVCPCGAAMYTSVTGLTTGHNYFFAVYAYNSYGYGPATITAVASPNPATPAPPTNVTIVAGNTTLAGSWIPPTATGTSAITSYLLGAVDQTTGAIVTLVVNCPCTNPQTATVTGVTNGDPWQLVVYAENNTGYGSPGTSNIATPPGPPPTTTTTSTTVPSTTTTTSTTVPSTTTTTVPANNGIPTGNTAFDKQGDDDSPATISCFVQAGRTVNFVDIVSSNDATEVSNAHAGGQYVVEWEGYVAADWADSANGTSRGQTAVSAAQQTSYPKGATLYLDLEDTGTASEGTIMTWVQNWATVVNGAGFQAGVYLGAPQPLTAADFNTLDSSGAVVHVWLTYSTSAKLNTNRRYQVLQSAPSPICTVNVDHDFVQQDNSGGVTVGFPPA